MIPIAILVLIVALFSAKTVSNLMTYLPKIQQYAAEYNISWAFLAGIVYAESDFNPNAYREEPHLPTITTPSGRVINDGSYGIAQLLYSTARGLGFNGEPEELFDPDVNLNLSAKMNRGNYRQFGNYEDTAAAYNSGQPLSTAPTSTVQQYVPKVIAFAQKVDPSFTA